MSDLSDVGTVCSSERSSTRDRSDSFTERGFVRGRVQERPRQAETGMSEIPAALVWLPLAADVRPLPSV